MSYSFPKHERYEPIEVLGQGGMGVVFRARDRRLGREIALKSMRSPKPESVSRLKAEFRVRARLHHPRLLPMLDLEVGPDHAFFTMDLIEGHDLAAWCRAPDAAMHASTLGLGTTLGALAAEAMGGATPAAGIDEARLRELPRLAHALIDALGALHEAGLVHRDVKPQNVLVDLEGEVRLADFGLTTTFEGGAGYGSDRHALAGTPGYMAPELFQGHAPHPGSDVYALGATLFHVLCGNPPRPREPVGETVEPVAGDAWARLLEALLASAPEQRPGLGEAREALRELSADPLPAPTSTASSPDDRSDHFVGRDEELAQLRAHWRASQDATTTTIVKVTGSSGVGKSTLVDHLLASTPDAIVLRGRCHPREHVAFGGFDEVVEQLVGNLAERGTPDPTLLEAAARLFPDIQTEATTPEAASANDVTLRRRGFAAIRRLLDALTCARPVVLHLEDIHWIEADAVELLSATLKAGGPARLLLVVTFRPEDVKAASPGGDAVAILEGADEIRLGGLRPDLTVRLFEDLVGERAKGLTKDVIAATGGHPILIREVARRLLSGRGSFPKDVLKLGALINDGIDELDEVERELVDLLAVSPWPVPSSVALRALPASAPPSTLIALQERGLARDVTGHREPHVVPFHDQIRRARDEILTEPRRRALHDALALAYEASGVEASEQLAHHHHRAGRVTKAGTFARRAAERALEQLAFRKAASHYEQAVDWLGEQSEDRASLITALGNAYAKAGLAQRAGGAFEQVAALDGGNGAPILTQAAEQYLHGGSIADGYRLLRERFSALGLRIPRSHRETVAASLARRAAFIAADPKVTFQMAAGADNTDLEERAEALWMATNGLIHVNHALADVMLLLHHRDAKRLGDPSRLVRTLTLEAGAEATIGGKFLDWRAGRLLDRAEAILAQTPNPFDAGWLSVGRGAVASFQGDWATAAAHASDAEAQLSDPSLGASFERSVNAMYLLTSLAHLGRLDPLKAQQAVTLADATERNDPHALNVARSSHAVLAWLATNDVAEAKRQCADLLHLERLSRDAQTQDWPEDTFRTPDYHNLVALTYLELYEGRAAEAYERAHRLWPRIEEALLLRVKYVSADLRFLRAKAALHAARLDPSERPASSRDLERDARRLARAMLRDGHPLSRAHGLAVMASLHASDTSRVAEAQQAYLDQGMRWHADALRLAFDPGDEGLAAAGIDAPQCFAQALAPPLR